MTSPLPMTAGRWVALVIGTPLALVAIGWTALTAVAWAGLGSFRVNLAVPVQPHQTAAVSVDTGDVSVSPGVAWPIRVHGILRYSLVAPPGQLAADAVRGDPALALPGAGRGMLARLCGHSCPRRAGRRSLSRPAT